MSHVARAMEAIDSNGDCKERSAAKGVDVTSGPPVVDHDTRTKMDRPDGQDSVVGRTDGAMNSLDRDDPDAVALLQQIFPDETIPSLQKLHHNRCSNGSSNSTSATSEQQDTPTMSTVASSHERVTMSRHAGWDNDDETDVLPPDFLRLPLDVAVRRQPAEATPRTELIRDLTSRVVSQHEQFMSTAAAASRMDQRGNQSSWHYVTKVVQRHGRAGGLGMTLIADPQGNVRVHALVGSKEVYNANSSPRLLWNAHEPPPRVELAPTTTASGPTPGTGPALWAGVACGDVLIGIDGVAFVESKPPHEPSLVQHAVAKCRPASHDPTVVLHLLRYSGTAETTSHGLDWTKKPSLLDTSDAVSVDSVSLAPTTGDFSFQSDLSGSYARSAQDGHAPAIHPFVKLMVQANLVSADDERATSNMWRHVQARSLQWDELMALTTASSDLFVPLHGGIRKALSVRIVNAFQDGDETAYTVWIHDVEWGLEWYAPVRYLRDFQDLRSATLPLCPTSIKAIPFPSSSRSPLQNLFRSPDKATNHQCETTCRQLEYFLRVLCAMIYKEKLHPYMAELAIHVQSFLGCDEQGMNTAFALPKVIGLTNVDNSAIEEERVHVQLKRCIQRYTYRLFLLDALTRTVDTFVDAVRLRGPRLQDIEFLESQGRDTLKAKAMADLGQIQTFLDKVQDMILEGCMDDFVTIAQQPDFRSISMMLHGSKRRVGYWDSVVREAVREQVEIEVYVPLRSVVSRWLVNGWRHEDMEVHFRMKELGRRSQDFFRITKGPVRYDWSSVSRILYDGVGLSTLPCVKLRAIVDAAREIFRIFAQSGEVVPDAQRIEEKDRKSSHLGADDFLPIFIYCVVQADMERPCALCVLLRTLCDRTNKIGEVGYYLMSFEAVIKHCEEVDLSEDREEMPSFLSIPLDDT